MELVKIKPIETERFILRAVTIDDASDMYDYAKDTETTKYVTFPAHDSIETSVFSIENFFLNRSAKGWPEAFGIVDKTNNKMIGTCDFWPLKEQGHYEMGYIIHKDYWGKGVMSEVASAVLAYAFNNYPVDVMHLKHVDVNIGSGKVATKLGFKKIGIVKDGTNTGSGVFDAMTYELRKEDYFNE